MNASLETEILKYIKYNRFWCAVNFILSEFLFWLAILSSFFGAIFTSNKIVSDYVMAMIVGIPALVLIINKKFKHHDRSYWHNDYVIRLKRLYRRSLYLNGTDKSIVEALNELENVMEKTFPSRVREDDN
jgi:hypothetical protein